MTCSVIGGMLSLSQSINQSITSPTVGGGAIKCANSLEAVVVIVVEVVVDVPASNVVIYSKY